MTDKPTITQADRDALYEAVMECVWGDHINGQVIIADHRESAVAELQAEVERKDAALWKIARNEDATYSRELARAALTQKEPVK